MFDPKQIPADVWKDFVRWVFKQDEYCSKRMTFPIIYGYATVGGYLKSKGIGILCYGSRGYALSKNGEVDMETFVNDPQDALIAAFKEVKL